MSDYAYYIVVPAKNAKEEAEYIGPFLTEKVRDEEVVRLTAISNADAANLRGSCRFTRTNHYRANIAHDMVDKVLGEKQIAQAA